jgi:tellurite resistance protein TerC
MLSTSDFSLNYWLYFLILFGFLIVIDRYIISKNSEKFSKNLYSTIFWFISAIGCCGLLRFLSVQDFIQKDHSLDFFTGYLIELSLSIDNVFVFIMIFDKLQISEHKKHIILRIGIISAVVLRLIMILFAIHLIQKMTSIFYIFGLILMISAIHMLVTSILVKFRYDKELSKPPFYQKYFVKCESDAFFTRVQGKIKPTINLLALILVEKSDILFAVDSIPAVISVTKDSFIIFASNIMAIAGLRALFFCVSHGAQQFQYLKHGIVLILFFIGIKLILIPQHIMIPKEFSLGFILSVIIGSMLISKGKNDKKVT